MARKVLFIRFSSIGDIVLTSPVIRSLSRQEQDVQIHYLTKPAFSSILESSPYIHKVHVLQPKLMDTIRELRLEQFELILDLHHNLRTLIIKNLLGIRSYSFPKGNWEKYQMVKWRKRNLSLPHIVERYAEVIRPLGAKLDKEGLDFFVAQKQEEKAWSFVKENNFDPLLPDAYSLVIGAKHHTKRWPNEQIIALIKLLGHPVVLLGGKGEKEDADEIAAAIDTPILSAVGETNLQESAALLNMTKLVVTPDTGMMHIAAALQKPIVSIWGNTIPEFGMYPYLTQHEILEIKDLDCRPCSKIGFDRCPKGHFRCMREITPEKVQEAIKRLQA